MHTAFVRMQMGRAIVRMPIITYASPLSAEELLRIVGPAARTLEHVHRRRPMQRAGRRVLDHQRVDEESAICSRWSASLYAVFTS